MNTKPFLSRREIAASIETCGIVAIIRTDSSELVVDTCQALREAGIVTAEITMTTPGVLEAIGRVNEVMGPDMIIGAGSVLDAQVATLAIQAGAQYLVAPILDKQVIETAHRYGKAVLPGALTPTEIMSAYSAGADLVKVFPAHRMGPGYIKDLLAPMPQLRLAPTGGINLETAGQYISAGAACIGISGVLVRNDLVETRDWKGLTKHAKKFVKAVKDARDL